MNEGRTGAFSAASGEYQGREELTNPIHSNFLLVKVKSIDLLNISKWQRKADLGPGGSAVRAKLLSRQCIAAAS